MDHIVIEKKCIIVLCVLYIVTAFFFVVAHYGLYEGHKRIITYYHMSMRAQSCKKKYDALITAVDEVPVTCTYVNREFNYLHENSASLLNCYRKTIQSIKNNISKTQTTTSNKISPAKKSISPVYKRAPKKRVSRYAKHRGNNHTLFRWPLEKKEFWLSSFFGPRKKPDRSWGFHYGIDMAALKGTLVRAAAAGTVVYAGYQRGYGNTVLISHADRYTTRYAHLDTITVSQGALVAAGRIIGTVGDTGYTITRGRDASHLHFEVSIRGKQVNPLPLLPSL